MLNLKRVLTTATILTPLTLTMSVAHAQVPDRDGAYVAVDGTVESTSIEGFKLKHDEGTIFVEFDDFDFTDVDDQPPVVEGDEVTVYGFVDDDALEFRSIEASSVYVDALDAVYYASGVDDEGLDIAYALPWAIATTDDITVTGDVTSVDDREFWLQTAAGGLIEVDTVAMGFNPLDDEGLTQVDPGDRVTVSGVMQDAVFDNRELSANSVIIIDEADQS